MLMNDRFKGGMNTYCLMVMKDFVMPLLFLLLTLWSRACGRWGMVSWGDCHCRSGGLFTSGAKSDPLLLQL